MADVTNPPVQPPEPGGPAPEPKSGGFFSTTGGKVVLGVIALVVLLTIVGVIVGMFMFGGIAALLNSGTTTVTATTVTSVPATTAAGTAPVLEPTESPLSASFTFRNVFAPSIKAPVPPATETSSTTAGSTDTPDTLYLIDIVSTDSGRQGVFVWNGTTYTLGPGGVIPGTPWKVVEVGSDSVVMLYGDTQVTLTLGQGISK